jgi:hypothetical protein
MHILFSLMAHENNDIVRLTIANVQQHVKNCSIVVHASLVWKDFDPTIAEIPGVYVNNIRCTTKNGDSQFGIHLSNYHHACLTTIPFTHFCILHTSEMFVKSGVEELIAQYPYSLWYNRTTMPRGMTWHPMIYALQNNVFDDLVPDKSWYLGSLIEGMWVTREIMEKMFEWGRAYPMRMAQLPGWCFEEVAFPTLVNWFGKEQPCVEPYNAFFDKTLETTDVDKVINGEPVELWAMNCWNTSGIPVLSNGANKYSVKRLSRDINDPVRQHIIQLTGLDLSAILQR